MQQLLRCSCFSFVFAIDWAHFFDNDNKQKQSVQSIFISNMLTAVVSDIPVNAKIVRFVHRICFRFEKQSLVLKFENLKVIQ